jgi:TolB-like protein
MSEPNSRSFWAQLRERKVIRAAIAYVVVGWVVIEVFSTVAPNLSLPDWSVTLVTILIVMGFPIAMILSWAFEFSTKGIRKDPAGGAPNTIPLEDPEPGIPSIAVLPFDDMSEKGDQTYFCEGIAEEILNALCKVANLRVASRVAAFQFGAKRADVMEIGRKLNVGTVLEGSVRKAGDRLRITAQLVNTSDGYHLWSRQFDRGLEDIFEIQEEIANAIANTLSITLQQQLNPPQQSVDPKAYDFFLRGLSYFARHTT